MPFIKREDIDPKIRAPYEGRHKASLRAALHNPGLTAEQRQHLLDQIRAIGQPKVYDPISPAKLGAITFTKE